MRTARLALGAVVALCVAGAACRKQTSATGPAYVEPTATAKLLGDLSIFALGKVPGADELAARERDIVAGKLSIDAYIDGLLKQPMGGKFAKDLVVAAATGAKERHPIAGHSILQSFDDGADTIYHLGKKCSTSEAVSVRPWWGGGDVKVCPSAYRPEVKGDDHGRTCGAAMLSPRDIDLCGCGPGLIYCSKDRKQFERLQSHVDQEVQDTTAYIVDGDRPIEQLFTMNETMRSADAEFLYRRARVAAGEDTAVLFANDLPASKTKLAPRHEQIPGQHAGILTAPVLTYSSDALRGVMRNYYDYLWCSGASSSLVTTEGVLGLGTVDLRVGDGWKQLASMNICTDCHARLDYGMQFFWGYPSSTQGIDFRPSMAIKGSGPLYGNNINEPRGSAELTPNGFAKLATSQPEFGDCMTRKVVDHVFNGANTAKDFAAVRDAFDETHKIKAMLKVAMQRYAKQALAKPAATTEPAAAEAATTVAAAGGKVPLSPALQKMIKRDCKECHDADDQFVLTVPELDHRTVQLMIDKVGFGSMPKTTEGLDDGDRRAFVAELAAHLYPPGTARESATAFFSDGMRAKPVHKFVSAMQSVTARANGDSKSFRPSSIETSVPQSLMSYTPGIAISAAVTALRACKAAGFKDAELQACADRASAPGAVVVGQ
jgi:hypothetical protein